jgi:hypothetical protein
MATSYNDQWVLKRSSERNTIIRRISFPRAVMTPSTSALMGVLRVPAGPIKQSGVSSIRAPLKAGRRDF